MVLPIREKQFFFGTSFGTEWLDFWNSLWRQAADALNNSERLVIPGYSLPISDTRARELLFSNVSQEIPIDIVSASDSERIAGEFTEHGFSDVRPLNMYFQEWIDLKKNRVEGVTT
jgi:hypothetical protein